MKIEPVYSDEKWKEIQREIIKLIGDRPFSLIFPAFEDEHLGIEVIQYKACMNNEFACAWLTKVKEKNNINETSPTTLN